MSRLARAYTVGPNELDLLLLKAALSHGDAAREAWQQTSRRIGSISQLKGSTYRLLPLLYRNLCQQGVGDPALERLKGVYRHSWYANHMLFQGASVLLSSLEQADIDTMVLKGGALARLYYDAPGTRPMEDVDVLVRRRQVRKAIEVLERNGWKLDAEAPIEGLLVTTHGAPYLHPRGGKLDLHWSPLYQPTDEQPFWDHAIPLEIGGAHTRGLCPEDQLLHLCVHGVSCDMRTPYWAADAVMLMRSLQGRLDWRRLVEQARANELSLALEHALRFLSDDFELGIPNSVLDQLSATPRSRLERLDHRLALAPAYRGLGSLRGWLRYRQQSVREGRRPSLAGFATYLRQFWGLENRRQLLGCALRKSGEILRHGVGPADAGGLQRVSGRAGSAG